MNVQHLQGKYRLKVTLTGVAITDVNRRVYASADDTLTFVPTSNSYVGKVVRYVAANTAEVEFDTTGEGNIAKLVGSNVADSAAIGASSTSEADFDKTYTIEAAKLKVGDVIKVRALLQHTGSYVTTITLTGKVYANTEVVANSGAITLAAQNDVIAIETDITVRVIGASGYLEAMTKVFTKLNGTIAGAILVSTGSVAEDISGGIVIKASGQYSASNANATAVLKHFTVEHLHAPAK
jgi:hypothetical protein